MTSARIALVTGATQGLGRAMAEGLAARMTPQDLVLLTGRDPHRVAEAAREVQQDPATRSRVEGRVLDVSDASAITDLAAELGERHGGVDVVISNAIHRIVPDRPQSEQADLFIDVSNVAPQTILRSFTPHLRQGGRMIIVASALGTLGRLDPRLHRHFDGASLDDVDRAVETWRAAVHNGTAQEEGWPVWLNVPSMVARVAAMRAVAAERREQDLSAGTLVASVCPHMVDTEWLRPWYSDDDRRDAQTPGQAARHILDLVFADGADPAQYGQLIQWGKVLPWHSGTPEYRQQDIVTP